MSKPAWMLAALSLGCRSSPSAPATPEPPTIERTPQPPRVPEVQPRPSGADAPSVRSSSSDTEEDSCDPLPRVGTACALPGAHCVESWGEPGGHSSALWCHEGRWQREEEANLP